MEWCRSRLDLTGHVRRVKLAMCAGVARWDITTQTPAARDRPKATFLTEALAHCHNPARALYCGKADRGTEGTATLTAGRPRTYKPDMVEKARRYIANHHDFDDPVPIVAGLACVLGVTRKTIYEWANDADKPEFSDILDELGQKQERCLIKGGLMGNFNAPITKMMMTKHGYSDRVDTDVTTNGKDMPQPFTGFTIERAQPDTPDAD